MKANIYIKLNSKAKKDLNFKNPTHYNLLRKLIVDDTSNIPFLKKEQLMNLSLNPNSLIPYSLEVVVYTENTFKFLEENNYYLNDGMYELIAQMFTEEICRPFNI